MPYRTHEYYELLRYLARTSHAIGPSGDETCSSQASLLATVSTVGPRCNRYDFLGGLVCVAPDSKGHPTYPRARDARSAFERWRPLGLGTGTWWMWFCWLPLILTDPLYMWWASNPLEGGLCANQCEGRNH